jgi:hypothetical protein
MVTDQLRRTAAMVGMAMRVQDQGEVRQLHTELPELPCDFFPLARTACVHEDVLLAFDQVAVRDLQLYPVYLSHCRMYLSCPWKLAIHDECRCAVDHVENVSLEHLAIRGVSLACGVFEEQM